MENKPNWIVFCVIALVIGLAGGYWYGNTLGYEAGYKVGDEEGYKRAGAEIQKGQNLAAEEAAKKAATDANPFQTDNPLADVNTDPFQKMKSILNPFQ